MQVLFVIAKSPGSAPLIVAADTLKLPEKVTVSTRLVEPAGTAPKLKLEGLTWIAVAQAFTTTCGFRKSLAEGVISQSSTNQACHSGRNVA